MSEKVVKFLIGLGVGNSGTSPRSVPSGCNMNPMLITPPAARGIMSN